MLQPAEPPLLRDIVESSHHGREHDMQQDAATSKSRTIVSSAWHPTRGVKLADCHPHRAGLSSSSHRTFAPSCQDCQRGRRPGQSQPVIIDMRMAQTALWLHQPTRRTTTRVRWKPAESLQDLILGITSQVTWTRHQIDRDVRSSMLTPPCRGLMQKIRYSSCRDRDHWFRAQDPLLRDC